MNKTPIRCSAVKRALAALAEQNRQLADQEKLAIDVYLDHRLTPESFEQLAVEGGLIIRFVRSHTSSQWEFDKGRFIILTHL
jgi:hypothetical protein